ncbi:MAG: hypothetical protein MJZ23_05710 [Paludibacteraceae bacterium]|nr:hypothetical protein [Paludibacteraceae bacterium]
MAHHFTINTQTTAGKRLQNEMRKRMRENIQRDQFIRENSASDDDEDKRADDSEKNDNSESNN